MDRISQFLHRNDKNEVNGNGSHVEPQTTRSFIASVLPHHPKSKSDQQNVLSEADAYSRFFQEMIGSLQGDDRIIRHELCNSLRTLENIIRLIDSSKVHYRVLLAVNVFKDFQGEITDSHREYTREGIFPSKDVYSEEQLKMVADAVMNIRMIVGLKSVQSALAVSWNSVKGNSEWLDDAVVVGNSSVEHDRSNKSEECEIIFREVAEVTGCYVRPSMSRSTQVNHWDVMYPSAHEELYPSNDTVYQDEPSSSTSSGKLTCRELTNSMQLYFPDTCADVMQHLFVLLCQDKSDAAIQEEVSELLGFELIELVMQIFEARDDLVKEFKATNLKSVDLNKFDKNRLIPVKNTGPIFCQQVSVQSKKETEIRKEMRKEQKRMKKEFSKIQNAFGDEQKLELELAQRQLQMERQLEIDRLKWTSTIQGGSGIREVYPYVFDARHQAGYSATMNKSYLPEGSTQENFSTHEEIFVPAVRKDSMGFQHVYVKDMDEIGQMGFNGFEKLNTIQSVVFEQAYKTRENLLICAPTGAGKTNIAMLTILNTVHEYMRAGGDLAKDDFKIIYIAPMKALATEMTESFGKRLAPFGMKVRELTGDTQISKKDLAETQMLVLTPEKWDVVTRKGAADNSLTSLVRLLIIDEVHLLQDDRGPVIETIVARTLRQVEMSQSGIRIVGLSATLPNYVDVATFLRVNPYKGLFFFDERFRPVPLTQKFIGVKKCGSIKDVNANMDEICYYETLRHVKEGHQVLVFVQSRNATRRMAQDFHVRASNAGHREIFTPSVQAPDYAKASKAVESSRNSQLFELFRNGYGIHHAGLVRSDRLLMEKMFRNGHISVLFCTSTLAWGVNLPAHAVVIRGTDVFDSEKGQFTDIGVLDVQQIFGRAGRPQYQNDGHGIIITSHAKLPFYLAMLTRRDPIESQFFKRLHDNLNAEISLGTVSTIDEAVEWLTYTYYYTRIQINPNAYGLNYKELERDPCFRNNLRRIITDVAVKLDKMQMIRFDSLNGFLNATDLGRIASDFYVKYETIEMINETDGPVTLSSFMPDDIVIALIANCSEFAQIKVREDECMDLDEIVSYGCMLPVRSGGLASTPGKVNVLLQALVSRTVIRSFSLSSEMHYITQNAGRLCRALFEIVLRRGWAQATNAFLTIARSIEKKLWRNQSSLRQLTEFIRVDWIEKIERRCMTESQLLELSPRDLSQMFSCEGQKVYDALHMLPRVQVEANFKPITFTIIKVEAIVYADFTWNDKLLGKTGAQSFLLLLENITENIIVHHEKVLINKKKVQTREPIVVVFTIPIRDHELMNNFQLRICSDYFLTEDTVFPLSMHNCVLPKSIKSHTDLLPLDPLPVTTLKNPLYEGIYNFPFFNPIQTQVFHTLYKTDESCLIGAPTGSGKTLCAELTMFRLLSEHPGKKCVYIAPLKALVRERIVDWKQKFEDRMSYKVIEISGDYTPESSLLRASHILITTPEKWDGITRSWATRDYVRDVGLVIIDEIHLLGVERGNVLEAIVTRLKHLTKTSHVRDEPARVVGLSTALANAGDVASWLGIRDEGLFNFRPSVRPVPIDVHIQGFSGQHYCPRMALMNKPAFNAILTYSPLKPVIVFVASRRQTRLTAMAFISHLVSQPDPRQWINMEHEELDSLLQTIKDENLKLTLPFGIGMHHAGLSQHERAVVEQLFLEKKIQVLIATATLAWGINMPAHLVIVKGTEYFDGKTCKYVDFPVTDVLQMMGRAGRPQFDESAVAVIFVQDVKKIFYKRFLYEPFPVESALLPVLPNHVNAEINAGTISSRQGIIEYISGTYFYRRLFANPNYYGLDDPTEESVLAFLVGVVDNAVSELVQSSCIIIDEDEGTIKASPYGRLASIYYLQHETMRFLLENLKENSNIEQLLVTLTHVPEYAEIPVRHNEDVVNGQIQKRLRIRFPTTALDSPFTKAHILFQAHFQRLDIPTDYRTDQKSVLDQCMRILQAMRDVSVLHKWFSTAAGVTTLQQMIYSARWYDDHPLSVLPGIGENEALLIGATETIPLLQHNLRLESMNDSKVLFKKAKQTFIEHYRTKLETETIDKMMKAIINWPILKVKRMSLLVDDREVPASLQLGFSKTPSIRVPADSLVKIQLELELLGCNKFNSEANLPFWSKPKDTAWYVKVGNADNNKMYACNFVPNVVGKRRVVVPVRLDHKKEPVILSVILSSDVYLGIDQEYKIHCDVV